MHARWLQALSHQVVAPLGPLFGIRATYIGSSYLALAVVASGAASLLVIAPIRQALPVAHVDSLPSMHLSGPAIPFSIGNALNPVGSSTAQGRSSGGPAPSASGQAFPSGGHTSAETPVPAVTVASPANPPVAEPASSPPSAVDTTPPEHHPVASPAQSGLVLTTVPRAPSVPVAGPVVLNEPITLSPSAPLALLSSTSLATAEGTSETRSAAPSAATTLLPPSAQAGAHSPSHGSASHTSVPSAAAPSSGTAMSTATSAHTSQEGNRAGNNNQPSSYSGGTTQPAASKAMAAKPTSQRGRSS
jgi:hypothetical protein